MKSPLEQNYYELLEVPRDATLAEIDRAYDRARAYYGAGSVAVYTLAAADELKLVQDRIDEAYLILADEKARAEYDARIGPPGPNERPLHREVRAARERDAARDAERRAGAEKREAEKREPTPQPMAPVSPPEPAPAREPTPMQPMAAVPPPEPVPAREPTPMQPLAAVAREPTPMQPMAAVAREPTPRNALPAVPAPRALEGPLPPPTMEFPEPAPRNKGPAARPAEASPVKPLARPDVPADAVFTGDLLKRLREAQGVTLQEIADRTKIGRTHLDNIENDRHAALPAQVYLRGFLMSLARELHLDPLRVSKSYLELVASSKGKAAAKPRS